MHLYEYDAKSCSLLFVVIFFKFDVWVSAVVLVFPMGCCLWKFGDFILKNLCVMQFSSDFRLYVCCYFSVYSSNSFSPHSTAREARLEDFLRHPERTHPLSAKSESLSFLQSIFIKHEYYFFSSGCVRSILLQTPLDIHYSTFKITGDCISIWILFDIHAANTF